MTTRAASLPAATLLLLALQACEPSAGEDIGGTGGSTGAGGSGGSAGGSGGTGTGTGGTGTGGSAGGSGGAGGSAPAVSFARDVRPVFVAYCNECHHPASATDFDFTNPFNPQTGIIGRMNTWVAAGSTRTKVVDPGNVDNSSIVTKVAQENLDLHVEGSPMPYVIPSLTPTELDAIRQWITSGASNDQFYAANVAPIFGTQITLGRNSGKCTWCHYPGSTNGMNVLAVFDATQGMVGKTSRYGGKIVEPGAPDSSVLLKKLTGATVGPQMPLQYPRLTAVQVQRLRDWIAAGAQNN